LSFQVNFMCRLFAYLGAPVLLERLLLQPAHSLLVQSYQPREMTSGLLNADGFGVGWYGPDRVGSDGLGIKPQPPYIYRNTLPIWSDPNLTELSRYVRSGCVLANVRSATSGQAVQLSNCQPFRFGQLLGIHNGFIENFQQSLQRPLRDELQSECYQLIQGTTDSEHIFALICQHRLDHPTWSLTQVLTHTLERITKLTSRLDVRAGLNLIVCDGQQIVACRYAYPGHAPSLYWLRQSAQLNSDSTPTAKPGDSPTLEGWFVASEPIWPELPWQPFAEATVLTLEADRDPEIYAL
jgi:ergothioneine biosynthesis protein EgtC